MKYIRTKDGRITTLKNELVNNAGLWVLGGKENILKIADTPEELCDEFVWVSIDNEYSNRKANLYGLKTSKMQVNCPQIKCIYGAIWTNKGLIYVAKMYILSEQDIQALKEVLE